MSSEEAEMQKYESTDIQVDDENLVQTSSLIEKKSAQKGRRIFKQNPMLTHKPSDDTDLEIMAINGENGSWKANTCMLSK